MTQSKIYIARKEVVGLVGGRRQLESLEGEGLLKRHYPAGHKRARYVASEVKLILDRLGGRSS